MAMADEPSFEDRAVGRFNNLVEEGFGQAAIGLWMDLLVRALMPARRDAAIALSPLHMAILVREAAPSSAAARKISAQLLEDVRKGNDDPHDAASALSSQLLRSIAVRCADELDERLKLGVRPEDLPPLVEVMRDLFGCDQILKEAGVISEDEDDEPNAEGGN
jgi:hypothetical protein